MEDLHVPFNRSDSLHCPHIILCQSDCVNNATSNKFVWSVIFSTGNISYEFNARNWQQFQVRLPLLKDKYQPNIVQRLEVCFEKYQMLAKHAQFVLARISGFRFGLSQILQLLQLNDHGLWLEIGQLISRPRQSSTGAQLLSISAW